jgi:hypothetical protein
VNGIPAGFWLAGDDSHAKPSWPSECNCLRMSEVASTMVATGTAGRWFSQPLLKTPLTLWRKAV